jgi:hypothetical protein
VSETKKQPTPRNLQQQVLKAGLLGGLVSGCAIILILAAALGIGLWLDASLSDGRRVYTFISIVVSVPVTFVVIFFLGRWLSAKMAPPAAQGDTKDDLEQENLLEDFDRGTN